MPVLVIDPCDRDLPEECSVGTSPTKAPMRGAGEPVPVADLDRQPEPGQRGDPAQAAQPAHDRGELAVGGHLGDRRIQPVPAVQRSAITAS